MDRPAEPDLALDVHHLAIADAHGGGDAHRMGEGALAQQHHGEAIDLSDMLARGVDQQLAAQDVIEEALADAVVAPAMGLERGLDVLALDARRLARRGEMVGLAQQVAQWLRLGGEALRIARQAGGVLDGARHRRGRQRPQPAALRHRRDQACVGGGVLRVALDLALHVGVDLEELRKIRVVLAQQVIDEALADQHHLEVQRHRLGLELHRAGETDDVGQRLDADPAGAQAALEPVPGVGLRQHLDGVEHQEAAIGPLQRAGADEREVAHQRAHVHHMLDAADEVLQRGVVFIHHRAGAVGGILDQQIDQVALHRNAAGVGRGLGVAFALRGFAQRFAALDDVLQHRVEPGDHLGQVAVGRLEVLDQVRHGDAQRLAAGLLDAALQLAAPARKLVHELVHALVHGLDVRCQLALPLFGQLLELLLRQGAVLVLHRHEGEAVRGAQQRDAKLGGFVPKGVQRGLLALLLLLLHRLDAAAVFVALEHRGDGRQQFLDEVLHVVAQVRAAAAGQAHQVGAGGVGEVVDVAPVRRRLAAAPFALEQLVDDGVASAAGFAEHEEVVAAVRDVEPHPHRLDGTGVDQRRIDFRQFGGVVERQRGGVARGVQGLRRKRGGTAHRTHLVWFLCQA